MHSGLEADQRVLTAHGVYSLTATTALTAQNTQGVHGVHVIPGGFVRKQVEAALGDVGAAAVKIGGFDLDDLLSLPLRLEFACVWDVLCSMFPLPAVRDGGVEGGPVPEGRIKRTDQADSIMVVEMPKYADDDGGQTEQQACWHVSKPSTS